MSGEHIERTLGNMEAKIDSLLSGMGDFRETIKEHESKIRNMELKQSYVAGMAAAVGMVGSLVMGWIKEHVK